MTEENWQERAQRLSFDVRDVIDGQQVSNAPKKLLGKYSPRDGKLLYSVPRGGVDEAERATASARRAFEDGRWSKQPTQVRKDVLFKLAALIDTHREELALLECLDVGKPIADALSSDLPMASNWLRYCAEAADKLHGKIYGSDASSLAYELRRPIGVVVGIIGWNFPLFLAVQKVGPALVAGNCLVLKPSEWTSLSAARLAQLAIEAGVPPGVFNVVHGDGALGMLLAHRPDVDLITFTGSSATGRALLVAAGQSNMKRLILECGGKAPNIVFDDCPDLDAVATAIVASAYWNQGEVCVASSRLLVQESIKSDLLALLMDKVSQVTPGDPLDPQTRYGALVSRQHVDKVSSYLVTAERDGTRLAYRGESTPPFRDGFYIAPHVFDCVNSHQRLVQEEIFGPVLALLSFEDEAHAVRLANATIYGLSATLWTKDLGRAHRVTYGIRAGSIVVNATSKPHGGVSDAVMSIGGHKQSGIGVEGGIAGLEAYTSSTAVQYFV